MTADASIYAPLTNAAYRAPAVKQPIKSTKKPWRETPLVESANLSEAAGWYGALSFHLLLLSYSVNASMVCACHLIGHCCCSLPILDGSSPITNEILMYLWKYLNGERSPSPMHTQKALAPGFQRHMRRRTSKPPSNPHLPLSQRHGSLNRRSRIFLKLETLQPSGSFKSRGIGHYCQVALERSARPKAVHFYASSGGNAGLACVFAAKSLGCPSTVVVPLSTKPMMIAKIRAAGATQVIQEGKSLKEAIAHLQEVIMPEAQARGEEAVFVPPFDHENVWRGNQTVFEEVAKQMAEQGNGEADVMACSVGGGGLLIGMLQGMTEAGWGNTEVLAVETEGAHSLSESLKMGELVALDGISSQATSLGAVKVAERCFELAQRHEATGSLKSVVLSDAEAAMGCWRFADDEKSLIELACGVNLALCYGGRLDKALGRKVKPDDRVVIVVCGGSNVTTAMVEGWRQEYGYLDDRHTHEVIPSAKTGLAMDLPTYGVPIDQAAGMAGGMPIRV